MTDTGILLDKGEGTHQKRKRQLSMRHNQTAALTDGETAYVAEIRGFSGYKSNITNMLLTQTQRAMSTTFFRESNSAWVQYADEYAAKQKKKTAYTEGEESSPCVQFL